MQLGSVALKFSKIAVTTLVALIIPIWLVGNALSGALGEADDAHGPILLVWPASAILSLIVIWRWGHRLSTWALAAVVISAPFWSVILFGPASEHHLEPFWAEIAVVLTWPLWGVLLFRLLSESIRTHSAGTLG